MVIMNLMTHKSIRNERTLINQGGTYMISIPKDYLIDLGWKTGEKILVQRNENYVTLNKADNPKIFSVGYEGKSKEEFIDLLKENRIAELVDVRNHAFSWKKGFSLEALRENLALSGIEYAPLPRLGAPKEIRVEIKENNNPEKFFKEYSAWLMSNLSSLEMLDLVARKKTTAMMCLEADYRSCHRKILGENLEERGFEVIQL